MARIKRTRRLSWTHGICDFCWEKRFPDKEPHRMSPELREVERCCDCGNSTVSGVYVRLNPITVRFPREELAT